MRVLLRSDISGVGKKGDIVDVAKGFARNFLFPTGSALAADPNSFEAHYGLAFLEQDAGDADQALAEARMPAAAARRRASVSTRAGSPRPTAMTALPSSARSACVSPTRPSKPRRPR